MWAETGGTNMLVTNILLGIIIVVLFAILDRLGDIFYSQTKLEAANEMGKFIDKLNDRKD